MRITSTYMDSSSQNPSSYWYSWFNRSMVVRVLEATQDLIVVSLCIGIFAIMMLQLWEMFRSLYPPINFGLATSDILSLLIFVELFRLLVIYLQQHEISIEVAVEVTIVSVLREIIIRGILETQWTQILCASVFLIVLGGILSIRSLLKRKPDTMIQLVKKPSGEF